MATVGGLRRLKSSVRDAGPQADLGDVDYLRQSVTRDVPVCLWQTEGPLCATGA
jgi:hypothetical protein